MTTIRVTLGVVRFCEKLSGVGLWHDGVHVFTLSYRSSM